MNRSKWRRCTSLTWRYRSESRRKTNPWGSRNEAATGSVPRYISNVGRGPVLAGHEAHEPLPEQLDRDANRQEGADGRLEDEASGAGIDVRVRNGDPEETAAHEEQRRHGHSRLHRTSSVSSLDHVLATEVVSARGPGY